jgi:rfaE bifunctional protein nucleotidyltransferase chain/domain/rfaE bifunctional protein kinase chain/domain
MTRLVVVGDALLDRDLDGRVERLAPDAPVPVVEGVEELPRPGGAGLAAALAAAAGHEVTLVCALGADAAGRRLRDLLSGAGVRVCDLGLRGATPEKVRVRASGHPLVRLDLGSEEPRGCGPLTDAAREALDAADAVLVSDYGRGVPAEPTVRSALAGLAAGTPVVWDPHPRGPAPVAGVLLATPNAAEAGVAAGGDAQPADVEAAARSLARRWAAAEVCVTLGDKGALLVTSDPALPPLAIPAAPVTAGDPCGAGDRFAATAAGALATGALPSQAVRAAVAAASAFVAQGGAAAAARRGFGAAPNGSRTTGSNRAPEADASRLAARVRGGGGAVVATGGCFDLLHAGHVRMLEAARALGDCLIVCLNSDASVARLKGPDRPIVAEADRAAVLSGLRCVDAVVVFGEDDPGAVLRTLCPHVWAKGGDYAPADLPERQVLEEWGGRVVIVPYVAGHSTTQLIEVTRGG